MTEYPKLRNAPLVLAVTEIRFPYAPRLKQTDTRDHLIEDLYDLTPLSKKYQQALVSMGPAGVDTSPGENGIRLSDRASVTAITVSPTRLVVETTRYTDFDSYRELVRRAVEAVAKHGAPAAIERVGVRYINEIRVDEEIHSPKDWSTWINPSLVGAASILDDCEVFQLEASIGVTSGPTRNTVLRYAAMPSGSIFAPDATLRHNASKNSPYFLVDIDGYWQPAANDLPEFDPGMVLSEVQFAHDQIEALFFKVPTKRLLEDVFQNGAEA